MLHSSALKCGNTSRTSRKNSEHAVRDSELLFWAQKQHAEPMDPQTQKPHSRPLNLSGSQHAKAVDMQMKDPFTVSADRHSVDPVSFPGVFDRTSCSQDADHELALFGVVARIVKASGSHHGGVWTSRLGACVTQLFFFFFRTFSPQPVPSLGDTYKARSATGGRGYPWGPVLLHPAQSR